MFIADALFMDKTYSVGYIIKSMLGFFPTADGFGDVNSPFWYITWMIMFYLLYPLVFFKDKPWLSAIILAVIATIIGTLPYIVTGKPKPSDRKSTRLNSSHRSLSRMPSSA